MTRGSRVTSAGLPSAISCTLFSAHVCSDSFISACITCSIMSTVTPLSRIARITGDISETSCGLRPASTSSSKRSFGSVASARASSRRLRPAMVRSRAGLSSRPERPTRSAMLSAWASAALRCARCRCDPTAMFSRTVCPANGCAIWKVRVIPRRQMRCGASPVTSCPRKLTEPASGSRNPERMPNSVDFPAPLGPMSEVMLPAGTARVTSSTALRPPKLRDRRCASSMSGALGREAPEQSADAARQERDHRDQHRSHRHRGTVGEVGIDVLEILDVERAGRGHQRRRKHDRLELDAEHVHAERRGRVFVVAHRRQPRAVARVLQPPGQEKAGERQGENDVQKPRLALELEIERGRLERHEQPDAAGRELDRVGENPENLGEGERHQREVRAAQPVAERERADEGAHRGAAGDRSRQAQPRIHSEVDLERGACVGAGAEKSRVTEGILAAEASEDIPGLAEQRRIERHDDQIEHEARRHERWHERDGAANEEDRVERLHARPAPKSPRGRNRRMAMKMTKMPIWPRLSPSHNPPTDSTTPMMKPPSNAPAKLPMPPSTTMVKAISTKPLPTCGLTY